MSQAPRTVVKTQKHFSFISGGSFAKPKGPQFSRTRKSSFVKYPNKNYLRCPRCSASFSKKSALMRHINSRHKANVLLT